MALTSKQPTAKPSPMDARKGEVGLVLSADVEAYMDDLPGPVVAYVEAHVGNGERIIVPAEGHEYPKGIVACVRDRKGLIGWAEDGAGKRLAVECLADLKAPKGPPKAPEAKADAAPPAAPEAPEGAKGKPKGGKGPKRG